MRVLAAAMLALLLSGAASAQTTETSDLANPKKRYVEPRLQAARDAQPQSTPARSAEPRLQADPNTPPLVTRPVIETRQPSPLSTGLSSGVFILHAPPGISYTGGAVLPAEPAAIEPRASARLAEGLSTGVFILHAPPGISYTDDFTSEQWCALADLAQCEDQVNTMPGSDEVEWVWYILSQFYEPVTFGALEYGILYDADLYVGVVGEICTPSPALTIETGTWPEAGSGIAIALVGEPYWSGTTIVTGMIRGWHDTSMGPATITLGPNPATGSIGWLGTRKEAYTPRCIGVLGIDTPGQACCAEEPPPPPEGACCFADGACLVLTEDDCGSQAGSYQGDDTGCSPNPCPIPPPQGACCFASGTCQVLTENDCDLAGGEYQGAGTGCSPNPCEQPVEWCELAELAQCEDQVNTMPGSDQEEWVWYILSNFYEPTAFMAVEYGILYDADLYVGVDGETCTPSPALTIESGTWPAAGSGIAIALMSEPFWSGTTIVTGMIHGLHYTSMDPAAITLGPNPDTENIGWLGTNGRTYQPRCIGVLGIDTPGFACCAEEPPPPPEGACCFTGGSCLVLSEDDCYFQDGSYQGDDTVCDPNPCPVAVPTGACCLVNGACQVMTAETCDAVHGEYQGDETDCAPNPCDQPVPTGACCFTDGYCQVAVEEDCDVAGGQYQGDGTDCSPNPCPVPPPPTGACCYESGACQVLTAVACDSYGGDYQGDDTDCSPNPCPVPPPPTGACCFLDGTCLLLTSTECGLQGGDYRGDYTPCSPSPCGPSQPGETFLTAIDMEALPFHAEGSLDDFVHDYDFGYGTSPDVVYKYEPDQDGCITIDGCDSEYDQMIFIVDEMMEIVAWNDDGADCDLYQSQIPYLEVSDGVLYYCVLDGYGGSMGPYDLDVSWRECPSPVECPPEGIAEGEGCADPYSDMFNAGCGSTPHVFSHVACCGCPQSGETIVICGSTFNYTDFQGVARRDADWYRLDDVWDPAGQQITATVCFESSGHLMFIRMDDYCDAVIQSSIQLGPREEGSLLQICNPAFGNWVIFMSTDYADPVWYPCRDWPLRGAGLQAAPGNRQVDGDGWPYLLTIEGYYCEECAPVPATVPTWGWVKSLFR